MSKAQKWPKSSTRSTRQLTFTESGQQLYQHCAKIVGEANLAYQSMEESQGTPSGTLKISAPPALGNYLLPEILNQYMTKNPDVTLDIRLENKLVDVIKEGYDVVIRSAKLNDSSLIAKPIMQIKSVVCATPTYFHQHSTPKTPEALRQHRCALYNNMKHNQELEFNQKDQIHAVFIEEILRCNHLDLIKQMVLNHQCIAVLPKFMVQKELIEGALLSCLQDYQPKAYPLYAIYPDRDYLPPKTQRFLHLLNS